MIHDFTRTTTIPIQKQNMKYVTDKIFGQKNNNNECVCAMTITPNAKKEKKNEFSR